MQTPIPKEFHHLHCDPIRGEDPQQVRSFCRTGEAAVSDLQWYGQGYLGMRDKMVNVLEVGGIQEIEKKDVGERKLNEVL